MRVLGEDPPGDGCLVNVVSGVVEKAEADSAALVEEIGFYFFLCGVCSDASSYADTGDEKACGSRG